VNDFLPLSVAPEIVTGLALGLVVHEGGHGLMCRVEDIDVESVGLAFLTVVPVGAFVEPDEEDLRLADRGAQLRMYTAGVTNNFAIALVALILLFGPVMGAFAVVDGAPVGGGVQQGTPAASAGSSRGGRHRRRRDAGLGKRRSLCGAGERDGRDGRELTLASGETVTVDRSVVVTSASPRAPVGVNSTITAVNGTGVNSEREFMRAARNHSLAELTFANGGDANRAARSARTRDARRPARRSRRDGGGGPRGDAHRRAADPHTERPAGCAGWTTTW